MTQERLELYIEPTVEELAECKTTHDKVLFIYNRHNDAAEDDGDLIDYYRAYFGSVLYTESTITRAGRAIRQRNRIKLSPIIAIRREQQRRNCARYYQEMLTA